MVTKGSVLKNNDKLKLLKAKLIELTIQNYDGDLTVRVKDMYGEVLYSEQFEGALFSEKYDIETLPIRNYFFEIEGKTKIKTMPFTITSEEVEFENELIRFILNLL